MMMSYAGHRIPLHTFPKEFGGDNDQEFSARVANPALGRPSLLSSQPHQPVAALRQFGELPGRLCDAVRRSDGVGAARLAGLDDLAPGWSLLLRAQGVRPRQP